MIQKSDPLGFIVWNVDPRIIPDLEFLRWYGLLWAAGIILGYQVMSVIYKKELRPQSELEKLVTYVILGVLIGARLGHILFYDPLYYWHNPIEILPFKLDPHFQFTGITGLASHGGVIGALFALFLYTRKYSKDYLWILDRLTIGASLLGCFIRMGNLMNSEIIGKPSTVPWAFILTRVDQIPRHPTQVYEAVSYFLVFVLLFVLWRLGKVERRKGFLFGLGLALIFIQRFLIEFIKEDQVAFEKGLWLNMGQWLSIPMILIGALFIAMSFKHSVRSIELNGSK